LGEIVVRGGKVRKVVLLGQTAPKIRRALEEAMSGLRSRAAPPAGPPSAPTAAPPAAPPAASPAATLVIVEAATLEDAIREARSDAVPGTTVLLSPACASFDMFRNFEARGAAFKAAVLRVAQGRSG
jgi:UDP-N-acetylmuramoylalanine-D-glutamate ligase